MLRLPLSRSVVLACFILSAIFVAACTNDNQTPPSNSAAPANSPQSTPASTPATTTDAARPKLNINTASQAELLSGIPGMGNRMVHEFEEYRPYQSIQRFRREIGKYVDPAKVTEYEQYIFVPIDINQADAPTLMQIPGLEKTEAESLIAGRPYSSSQAFLTKLAESVSAAEVEIARTYLVQQ